jgi:hypothetical protein
MEPLIAAFAGGKVVAASLDGTLQAFAVNL